MKRIGFLPAFFVALAVVFVALVVVRIRSHQLRDAAAATSATAAVDEVSADAPEPEPLQRVLESARPALSTVSLLDPPAPAPLFATPVASAAAEISPPRAAVVAPAAAPARSERVAPRPAALAIEQKQEPASAPAPVIRASTTATGPPSGSSETVRDPHDPTSDSQPPQLATIDFVPRQIADGEETMLVIQATDELSGIRSVSGTIVAPSGAVQGFACQHDLSTNRYIARVIVPKEAAEGTWAVNYLNLTDNASNALALTAARGGLPATATFRVVSSRPDSEGPSLHAVWLDRRSMRGGEKNLLFVRADDDQSGVNLVSGIFQSPSRQARVGFVCRGGGDATWTCEVNAPACADCGEWQLEQLQMQDKANNMTTLRAAQSELVAAVRLDISSDMCDATPPAVQSVALDRPVVSNVEQSTIGISVRLTDDACGVLSVSGQATGPQTTGVPPRLYFSFTAAGDSDPHLWNGRIVVPRLAAKGTWRVSFLQVLDRGQNLKTYTANDPMLAGATFVVD